MLMQNPYSKFVLAIKTLSIDRLSTFSSPIATKRDLDADKKLLFLLFNRKKFSQKFRNQTPDFKH